MRTGRPISGASVRLVDEKSGKAISTVSKEDGSYMVTRIHGAFYGRMHLVVSKAGYDTTDRIVEAKQHNSVDAFLTPSPR